MPDLITLIQKVVGRLTRRDLFRFRPESWDRDGIQPDKLRNLQARLGSIFGPRLFSRIYPGVAGRVHIHDTMLMNDSPEEISHYIGVGRSAVSLIEELLRAGGRSFADLRACLHLGCGYGRVVRLLCRRLDPSKITTIPFFQGRERTFPDIHREARRFCTAEFGVRTIACNGNLRAVRFSQKYDLIWLGAIITNLEPSMAKALLIAMAQALDSRGVLIFTTQGPSCLRQIPSYGFVFEGRETEFVQQMQSRGVAYLPYYVGACNDPGYGITFHSREYIRELILAEFGDRLKLIGYMERGWDDHQDVWAFQKAPSPFRSG